MQMNHSSSSLLIPCIIPLFRDDLLSTVGSTQSCSLFPHTRAEDLPSWSCFVKVGFVAAVKDCLWSGVAAAEVKFPGLARFNPSRCICNLLYL